MLPDAVVRHVFPRGPGLPQRAVARLTTLGMVIALGMLIFGGVVLHDARQDAWRQAQQSAENLVVTLARTIARNIATYDLSLQGASAVYQHPGGRTADPELFRMALFDRAADSEYMGSLLVIGADGVVLAASTSTEPPQIDLSDRDYFRVHRQQPDLGLYVSDPFASRLRDADPSLAMSRRIANPDGSFGGVVSGTLRLAYFQDLFAQLNLGHGGSVVLVRSNGRLVARYPYRAADIGRDMTGTDTFSRVAAAPAGQFVATAPLDGVRRLYTFRQVSGTPLAINVAMSLDDIYAAWWRKAWGLGAVLVLLSAAVVLLCLFFRREVLRRLEAEVALREAAEQLAAIASTDALTGLANRRKFDAEFEREWTRAARNGMPISLLILDADFFKAYNDTYGHAEGDDILRGIGAAMRGALRRSADLGARYGGEEFSVLLPEEDLDGALQVAEAIRHAVDALGVAHAGSPFGRVTVSVGVAMARPVPGEACGRLLEEADAALYQAKRGGRNRVEPVRQPPSSPFQVLAA